jgi:nucleoside-diphosphate-sugar epimerase
MKALVIGGTGPTGPYIIDGLLERGYEVIILHTGAHETGLPEQVEHIHADPHFEETLEAALGKRSFDLAVATYGRLRFTARVMRGRVPRFVSVGGGAFYKALAGHDPNLFIPIPIPENSPLQDNPEVSKFSYRGVEAEWEVMKAHHSGYYNATHLRYPLIYGPRQNPPREWSIIRRILDGRKRLIISDGGLAIMSRGFALNMARAVLLAVDMPRESCGQIYNVRDETLLTVRNWINLICRVMDYQFEFVDMPYALSRPAHIYCGLSRHQAMDISCIKQDLGYRDAVPVEKALETTVKWCLDNLSPRDNGTSWLIRDPFDYTAEDRIIDEYKALWPRLLELQPPALGFQHSYAHPRNPAEIPPT